MSEIEIFWEKITLCAKTRQHEWAWYSKGILSTMKSKYHLQYFKILFTYIKIGQTVFNIYNQYDDVKGGGGNNGMQRKE